MKVNWEEYRTKTLRDRGVSQMTMVYLGALGTKERYTRRQHKASKIVRLYIPTMTPRVEILTRMFPSGDWPTRKTVILHLPRLTGTFIPHLTDGRLGADYNQVIILNGCYVLFSQVNRIYLRRRLKAQVDRLKLHPDARRLTEDNDLPSEMGVDANLVLSGLLLYPTSKSSTFCSNRRGQESPTARRPTS
ncbi:hypothetical protein BC834DRAFT_90380 [Gloeopeniophorella convolvens]|nr:hypothetical protein BC834DRAFT_90380 [Gloeopeniophorella convolvens]